jgi:hypothetical protein
MWTLSSLPMVCNTHSRTSVSSPVSLSSLPLSLPPYLPTYLSTYLPTSFPSNEPHGLASWGESNPLTDYNHYYERLINRLAAKYPDWKVRASFPSLTPSRPPVLALCR